MKRRDWATVLGGVLAAVGTRLLIPGLLDTEYLMVGFAVALCVHHLLGRGASSRLR